MSFVFTDENLEKIKAHVAKYPKNRQASAVLPLLDLAQRQCGGWLPQPAIEEVSKLLDMPFMRVMEVASFYTLFNLKPVGTFHVQICGTTPCWLKGSEELKNACEHHAAKDPVFTISEVECLGACVNAPVVQINDDYYENLTSEELIQILKDMKKTLDGHAPTGLAMTTHLKKEKADADSE